MSAYKFDAYEGYRTGDRFASNLLRFLSNFKGQELDDALTMATKIIFISAKEMHELSMEVYYKIKLKLLDIIINDKAAELEPWEYGKAYSKYYLDYLEKSLFVAMSDSSKIDYFRRHAQVDNESIISTYKIDVDALIQYGKKNEERNPHADYENKKFIFLIDDFSGSGYTFLRQLQKFHDRWYDHIKYRNIFFCPYIITDSAFEKISRSYSEQIPPEDGVSFEILPTLKIPLNHTVTDQNCMIFGESKIHPKNILSLCDTYYHESIEDDHTRKNGGVKYGFGNSGLLVVKHDNSPNDSLFLIWFKDHKCNTALRDWNPLFPRIPRHKNLK